MSIVLKSALGSMQVVLFLYTVTIKIIGLGPVVIIYNRTVGHSGK